VSETSQIGKRVAAIFDLDGTLLPEPSLERRFFAELRRNGRIPVVNYLRWAIEACGLLPQGRLALQHANKRYLTDVATSLTFRYVESIAFFEEGIARVAWHAQQKHEIVLLTGTLEPLARLAAMALECELEARGINLQPWVCATQLAEYRGRWTGQLIGKVLQGPAKAYALKTLASHANFALRQSHAYGNSWLDRYLLCAVGHANAVNPGEALAAFANEKDWPIWHWHLEKKIAAKDPRQSNFEILHIEGRA
jgi:phosphoserine phosphatase